VINLLMIVAMASEAQLPPGQDQGPPSARAIPVTTCPGPEARGKPLDVIFEDQHGGLTRIRVVGVRSGTLRYMGRDARGQGVHTALVGGLFLRSVIGTSGAVQIRYDTRLVPPRLTEGSRFSTDGDLGRPGRPDVRYRQEFVVLGWTRLQVGRCSYDVARLEVTTTIDGEVTRMERWFEPGLWLTLRSVTTGMDRDGNPFTHRFQAVGFEEAGAVEEPPGWNEPAAEANASERR
jgi:hypothetical protein